MDKKNDIILVTGATGKQGGAVARQLLSRGYRVKAMTRHTESGSAGMLRSAGAEIVYGNYDEPESLSDALSGVWGVFAVQNTWEAGVEREEQQGKRFAELARAQNVQHYVYTSVGSANRNTGIPHFENKWRIEERVRSLKFPSYAILRPVFFMENFLSSSLLPGIQRGRLALGLRPDTRLQMIAVDDIGKFGLMLFEHHEAMNRAEIDIAGDEHTMPEIASYLGRISGRSVEFLSVPREEVRKSGDDRALMLEWFDRTGYNVAIDKLEETFGIRLTKFEEWARKMDWSEARVA